MYRPVDQSDHFAIALVISQEEWRNPQKGWTNIVNTDKVICAMCGFFDNDGIHSVVIKDSYVMVYMTETPWFTHDKILNIFLVYKVADNGGTFQDVIDTAEDIAKRENCTGICMGTALAKHDEALERMFLRNDYVRAGIELYKEL